VERSDFNSVTFQVVRSNRLPVKIPEHPEEFPRVDNRGFYEPPKIHREMVWDFLMWDFLVKRFWFRVSWFGVSWPEIACFYLNPD